MLETANLKQCMFFTYIEKCCKIIREKANYNIALLIIVGYDVKLA